MIRISDSSRLGQFRIAAIILASLALAACEEGQGFTLFEPAPEAEDSTAGQTTKLIERDVEAPDVFSVTEAGLWDGRPSLGGVWAAHPDVKDPERVIVRNQTNGKFVIGALFRRERDIPGPRIQISADAAEALGMLAGQPVELNVTALRREEVPEEPLETAETETVEVTEEALDPIAAATAAVASAEEEAKPPTQEVTSETAPTPPSSSLEKPYVQIGIFSVEANAKNAASQMRSNGMVPLIKKMESKGKTFWRVLVGPATSKSERSQLMKKIHSTGFTDAYAVSN